MKKIAELMIGMAIAAAAIIALGQGTPTPPYRCYHEAEIMYLMVSNGWTQEKAEDILTLSCEYPIH
ncbi:MAG TPA: hypothetical protein VIS49_14185 [Cyclobacteriaceae bacterium]